MHKDLLVHKDLLEIVDRKEIVEHLDHKDNKVPVVQQDRPELKVVRDNRDCKVQQEIMVHWECLETQVLLEALDR